MPDSNPWAAVPFHFWSVVFFSFGCIVGSLLNVCIHRMPRGESIVTPRSHCPHCQYSIPWHLNIPLVTWLYLGGKCSNCKAPISFRYFLVELLTGATFLNCWLAFGGEASALALVYCLLLAGFIVATFIDVEHFIIPDEITLGGIGSYNTPKDVHGSYRGGTIGASPAYSFSAHVAEVEVDGETGQVRVRKLWVAHDCGRALNPVLVEGQMEGSAAMGFGEAIFEEQAYDERGLHRGPSLLDYPLATTLDTPELESLIVESGDREGPYGAKEAGEGPLHPSIPAIANAIHDAVGVRLKRLPFHPPRVLAALDARRTSGLQWKGP